MTPAPAQPRLDRALTAALALGLLIPLSGCLSEVTVLESEDDGAAEDPGRMTGFGNAGSPAPAPNAGGQAADEAAASLPMLAESPPIVAPPVRDVSALCGGGPLLMGARCSTTATELFTERPELYQLSATTDYVYAAARDGIHRARLSDGTVEQLRDEYTTSVLADDQRFYWADDGSLSLDMQVDDGPSEVFLPAHGSIDGVSQDDAAIFAIADGFLFRVSKETKEAQPLVDGTNGMQSLHWSQTAVDDEHVYFVSSIGELALERIRKDGTERTLLASGIGGAMDAQWLLVDEQFVYLANVLGRLQRVPVTGGVPEELGRIHDDALADPVIAQDDTCLYYADGGSLYCLSKTECTTELVYTVDEGAISALTMRGTELYFAVTVDSPAAHPKSWVGSLQCPAES